MGIYLVVSLYFEPTDGRVCRATCPTLARCTHVFLVYTYTSIPYEIQLIPDFLGPKCIFVVLSITSL